MSLLSLLERIQTSTMTGEGKKRAACVDVHTRRQTCGESGHKQARGRGGRSEEPAKGALSSFVRGHGNAGPGDLVLYSQEKSATDVD